MVALYLLFSFLLIIQRTSFSHSILEMRQREERDALNFPLEKRGTMSFIAPINKHSLMHTTLSMDLIKNKVIRVVLNNFIYCRKFTNRKKRISITIYLDTSFKKAKQNKSFLHSAYQKRKCILKILF